MIQFKWIKYITFIKKDKYKYTLYESDFQNDEKLLNKINNDLKSGEIVKVLDCIGRRKRLYR